MLSTFGLLLSLGIYSVSPQDGPPPILGWKVGLIAWAMSIFLVPIYYLRAAKIERAVSAYAANTLALLVAGFAILDGSIRLSVGLIGQTATLVIALSLAVGLGSLPWVIKLRRRQFRYEVERGHLRRSLNRASATWNARYDRDKAMSADWLRRPGCLVRVLPWIGPAIGMRVADLFGRGTANTLIAASFLGIGYALVYFGLAKVFTELLEFRRLEKELGRPILLAEEPTPG